MPDFPPMPLRQIPRHPSGQLSLPGWDSPRRALPSQLAKSAVFTACRDRDLGVDINRQVIPSIGATVEYEGPLLNQSSADVFECLVHEYRGVRPQATRLHLRPLALVRLVSQRKRIRIDECERVLRLMLDLSKAHVRVMYADGSEFAGTLISYEHGPDDSYDVAIHDHIVRLFWDAHVLIDWRLRVSIRGELAKWLQHYFAASLDPQLIEEIRALSASQTRDLYRFRQAVKKALVELVRVGVLTNGEVGERYVRVSIEPTGKLPPLPRLITA